MCKTGALSERCGTGMEKIIMEKIVEICCGSYEDALAAYHGGAKRIELNSALYLGGLTPSLGTLLLTKDNTDLKVIAMVRPRGAGFCYSDADFRVMKADARLLLENGADGIAFGCLTENGELDESRTREMTAVIKKHQGEAVFHRAFDCVQNPYQTIEKLIEIGIDRVLTSGGEEKAMNGIELLAGLQEMYGDKIELLAGSGINAENAKELMERTGIRQVHSSCRGWLTDRTTEGPKVSYAYAEAPHKKDYEAVNEKLVKKLVDAL